MTDWYLIRKFREDRSEAAFEQLVSRYLKLVYSVCYAELQNAQAAEDATQAVFLILARKAEFRRGSTLSSWLFQTARHVASHARNKESRRNRMQRELEVMHRDETQNRRMNDNETIVLTEALAALRDADREALLLRYYQELSLAEVGDALGVSEDAARKRIARGLNKVRAYLGRYGVANALGALTAGMAIVVPLEARSEAMTHAISQGLTPAIGVAASTAANQLTLEVLKKMAMMKLKWTVAAVIVIAGAGSGTAYVMGQGTGGGTGVATASGSPRTPSSPPAKSAATAGLTDGEVQGLKAQLASLSKPLMENELQLLKTQLALVERQRGAAQKSLIKAEDKLIINRNQYSLIPPTKTSKKRRQLNLNNTLASKYAHAKVDWESLLAQEGQLKEQITKMKAQLDTQQKTKGADAAAGKAPNASRSART